jgi:alcohol dehydrogenase
VDATGSAEGLPDAVQMVRPRGTVVLKSTVHQKVAIDTAPIVVNELTLVGSRCGRFEPALELIGGGRLRLAEMVSDRFPLDQSPRAFERAAEKGALKVLLRP